MRLITLELVLVRNLHINNERLNIHLPTCIKRDPASQGKVKDKTYPLQASFKS